MHAKIFPPKILFYKKFFDFSQIFRQYKKHFKFKFLKISLESDNFLLNAIFGQSPNVGVNYVTSDSASVEANREVNVASIVWTCREDFNCSHDTCEIDLKLFWRPLAASLQSYLKTPRILDWNGVFPNKFGIHLCAAFLL